MLPVVENTINDLTFIPLAIPSRTYLFDLDAQRVQGVTDRREAMKQTIYLILHTERYQYAIYSWGYGAEMGDLVGQPIPFVLPEIKRRVTDALLHDGRITAVDNWGFETQRRTVKATFTAHTIYGEIDTSAEVIV